jgi:hypothetical protein
MPEEPEYLVVINRTTRQDNIVKNLKICLWLTLEAKVSLASFVAS